MRSVMKNVAAFVVCVLISVGGLYVIGGLKEAIAQQSTIGGLAQRLRISSLGVGVGAVPGPGQIAASGSITSGTGGFIVEDGDVGLTQGGSGELVVESRNASQELLKTASGRCAAAGGLVASHDSNVTSCAKAATGVYDWNISAAGFTRTPDCGCTTVSTTGSALNVFCHLDTAGESATVIRTRTRVSGSSDFDTVHNLVCVGR